jgi:hypothetical protein
MSGMWWAAIVVVCAPSVLAYLIGRAEGLARERARAYGDGYRDGYRAGEKAGMGAPSPRYERWNLEQEDDLTRFRHGEPWDGPDDMTAPPAGYSETGAVTVPHRTRGGKGAVGAVMRRRGRR